MNTISQLSLINSAVASTVGGVDVVGSDYKALVCLFLRGGCDMNNVLIPVVGNSQAESYTQERGVVGVPNGVTNANFNPSGDNLTLPLNGTPEPLGLHPSFTNLQGMYNAGEAAFVTNVGTLAEPTTRSTYTTAALPCLLYTSPSPRDS